MSEEDPRVLVEGLLELLDIAVVEAINIELDDPNDLVAIRSAYALGRRQKSHLVEPLNARAA
jgi:hypothetical protein